jgi:hypothetical protein
MDSTALAIVLAGFGLVLILVSYRRLVQHRTGSALGHGLGGAALFLFGALLFTVALNFNTYERWQADQPVAQLSFEKTGLHSYRVSLMRIPSGDLQVFNLNGDEWRMEAQQLSWSGWSQRLGLQSGIRLQYLLSSGKDAGKAGVATQYTLSRNPGIDLWKLREQHPQALRNLTVRLLSSDNVPLTDDLRYHLYATTTGLNARAINQRTLPSTPTPVPTVGASSAAASYPNNQNQISAPTKSTSSQSLSRK